MKDTSRRDAESSESSDVAPGRPGGSTLTQRLPVQRKAAAEGGATAPSATSATDRSLHSMFDFSTPFDDAVAGGGGAVPHQAQMERAFGRDLAFVRSHTGEGEAMGALGAQAAARGSEVAFAEANPSPWLVAHELPHVMQQQHGGAAAVDRKATVAPSDSAAEVEADRVADRVVAGESAGTISAQPGNAIYRFAPNAHQNATVSGLSKTYSAEEIGAIYASNWERDFSQGHPDIGSAAIAWTAVKNHASKHGGDPGTTGATFTDAIWKVVNGSLMDATTPSLGTSQTWEHMDAPDDKKVREAADKRWAGKAAGVAGYLMDSKAHIKDQMVAAIDVYRLINNAAAVGGSIDNWNGAAKPDGYTAPNPSRSGTTVSTHFPPNFDDKAVASRDPIKEQTADQAKAAGAKSDPSHNATQWALVAQHLGRAMHAFEDFWAHSNWLELAKLTYARVTLGDNTPSILKGEAVANKDLKTGTFGRPAQAHALGHKLVAMSNAFTRDFDLMLKVYGRTSASTKLDDKDARSRRSTAWGSGHANDHDMAYGPLTVDSWSTLGEISDVGTAVNNVEELVLSKKYTMADFLCNRDWLAALAGKGQILITQGDENSDADSHGKIAKDQDEHGSDKDHGGGMAIARAANEKVFGPLRAIMDEQDAAKALAATQAQLALVDTMIQAPSASHPLWSLVAGTIHEH